MIDKLSITIEILSYFAGAWLAFQIFDRKKKGKKQEPKDDLFLWPMLILFVAGFGTFLSYLLKSWLLGQ